MANVIVHKAPPDYCGRCYDEARKHGRTVRKTDVYDYPICSLCESRIRNGLVKYRPSNGTEFLVFLDRCSKCRHWIDDTDDPQPGNLEPPYNTCQWGVLDRFYVNMAFGHDHISNWFDPADLDASTCPATCKRFTHRNDGDGETRDPPPVDCEGQMFFGDLDVPREPAAIERTTNEGATQCQRVS